MDKTKKSVYIFNVILREHDSYGKIKEEVSREVAVLSTQSLSTLAQIIVKSFNFNYDHCFGFYDNLENPYKSKEMYELFTDIGEDPTEGALGVEHTKVSKAFNKVGKKLLFLFDYGDNWYFVVKLIGIRDFDGKDKFPKILKSVGSSPEQYPPLEEDEGVFENLETQWHFHEGCDVCQKLKKSRAKLNWYPDENPEAN